MPDAVAATGRWYGLATVIVAMDQGSKWLASSELAYATPVKILSWFNLTLHHNEGAAFSFLAGAGGWQRWFFAVLALVVSGMIAYWIKELKPRQWQLSLALALVLGGALGNLVDRVYLGYVVDFISVHYRDWYFPTFNVADAAISVGAFLIIIDSVFNTVTDSPSNETGHS
ncbi:signal peptidase II [Congregibacter sp.]|uniref:signal peptidase II n=1 Tax=Congregibacter sp. TaxID=2744308 RepID=UPI003F6B2E33